MAWNRFGADASAVMVTLGTGNVLTLAPAASATIWNAEDGGTQFTDVRKFDDTTWSGGTVVADSFGILRFKLLDAVECWVDLGLGARQFLPTMETASSIGTLDTQAWRKDQENLHNLTDANKSAAIIQAVSGQVADIFVCKHSDGKRTGYFNEKGELRGEPGAANSVPFRIKQYSDAQSASLTQWTNSANSTVLSAVDEAGTHVDPTLFKAKTGDTARPSTTALADDPHLLIPVKANKTYLVEAYLIYDGIETGDLKLGWRVPTGARMSWTPCAVGTGTGVGIQTATVKLGGYTAADAEGLGCVGAGTKMVALPRGILVVGSTAGDLALQWAQNASNATATTLFTDSWLRLIKMTV